MALTKAEIAKRWRDKNPDYHKELYKNNQKSYRERRWKQLGISFTHEEYLIIFNEQGGRCKICGVAQEEVTKSFALDHCHISGKIRGLLCRLCNTGIGSLKDSPELLEKAAEYIRQNQ